MINKQQLVSGVSTVDAPAAATDGEKYLLAWTTSDKSIWWTTCPASNNQKSYEWVKQRSISDAASSGGPALVNFKDKVWMAWKGEGGDPRIFLSSLTGSTWSPGTPVSGVGTSSSPALTATSTELFLACKGEHDDAVFWAKSSDGKAWSAPARVPGAASSDTPALAAFEEAVYLAYKGASDSKIWLSEYASAKGWGAAAALPSDFETSAGPALGVGDTGNLHLVWKGASNDFVWESTRDSGSTRWSAQAKIVAAETSARPALASQTSSATDILFAWKGATTTDLLVAPLDGLHRLFSSPPGARPLPTGPLIWQVPVTGFGSGPNRANFSLTLVLSADGKAIFSGEYTDSGTIPIFTAPAQNYSAVAVVLGSNKVAFTFSHSKNQVPTGGAVASWNITQTNAEIAIDWAHLEPVTFQASCTNNMDLGEFLDEIVADVKEIVGLVETAIQVISVIAS
jgi:hypothetical protein